ncbi:hypothetical protein [Mesorhizobium sp.]|uniref:hypothetical protein n=1 Tax=Mesorhizobium sp. TaxID=1871066 RepID=UPI000FE45C47|nr:hypothetical protein [Mesorhizobium sp.]RWK53507.1 MAG: hypothetical protein EOR48_22160 [Mesorhizobium sp.]
MAEPLPTVVGDPAATKVIPVILIDSDGNPTDGSGASASEVQGTAAAGAAAVGNPVQIGGFASNNTTGPAAEVTGDVVPLWMSLTGAAMVGGGALTAARGMSNTLMVGPILPTGSRGLWGCFGFKYNGTSWDPDALPSATGRIVSSAASTNATVIKASAGNVHRVFGKKATAVDCFLKIYNKATAPTVGTDTPIFTLPLSASSPFNFDLGGHYFSAGIGIAITLGAADADTAAVAAGDVVGLNVSYA